MSNLIVKNGLVFDPLNNINGETKDLLVENGKIVESFKNGSDVEEIDAQGKTVVPGALDIHSHVASQQLNWARLLGRGNSKFNETWQGLTLHNIARNYLSRGYTFLLEANVFPSLAKQTVFDFLHLPVLDKSMLLNVSNLWAIEPEIQREKIGDIAIFLSDLMNKTKAFGLKAYNPFEAEEWNFQKVRENVAEKGRLYNFSAINVYTQLLKANELMNLPHSLHAHIEGYETATSKTNLGDVLIKVQGLASIHEVAHRNQILHLAHASSYNVDGDNSNLIELANKSNIIDLDLGFICFDPINPLVTSDRRLANHYINYGSIEGSHRVIRMTPETEGDSFSLLRSFEKSDEHDSLLWSNALDLAFHIEDKYKLQFSLNFPNYGDIKNAGEVATWLMSLKARKGFMNGLNLPNEKKEILSDAALNYSFTDYIIISRASPAKSLGLSAMKGHLGEGADADINILNLDISNADLENDFQAIKNALNSVEYVIKDGNIVKKGENIDLSHNGSILWAEGKVDGKDTSLLLNSKKEFYTKYGSLYYEGFTASAPKERLRKIE